MGERKRKRGWNGNVKVVLVLLVIVSCMVFTKVKVDTYRRYESSTSSYEKAEVIQVIENNVELDERTKEYYVGSQELLVKLKTGAQKNSQIQVTNYLTASHNVYTSEGSRVIVCVDAPENVEPYYSIYNYDRSNAIYLTGAVFFLLLVAIGGRKGIRSGISIIFTMYMIVKVLIPLLYNGKSAVLVSLLVSMVCGAVSILLISGIHKKAMIDVFTTLTGLALAGGLYWMLEVAYHVSGYQTEEAQGLILIAQNTGLQIKGILFAGVLISSLGALMDVVISLSASIEELNKVNGKLTRKQLFLSGLTIGKDMIGTMSNTLILAFTGGALTTLLVLTSYGVGYHQLLSSDYLAIELAKGLAGTGAVILMVPVTSFICSIYQKQEKYEIKIKNVSGGKECTILEES